MQIEHLMKDKQWKILVVDDTQIVVTILKDLLETANYIVDSSSNGIEAIEKVKIFSPDLIILDIMMPLKNGYEVCQEIKSSPETRFTPVVMITGLDSIEDKIKGIEAGADDFLTKPFNNFEVLARAKSLLRQKEYIDELENAEAVLISLAMGIEAKDPYTEGHCERLSRYSVELGKKLGLPDETLRTLKLGGIMHDIGKIGIPDAILIKPGKLTPEEWKIMKEHPIIGERICAPLKSLKLVCPIIRHHHEKWNGTGYPDGLKGKDIPLTARILQVADVYDALSTSRSYRAALPIDEVCKILREEVAKEWWDRELVEIFIAMIDEGKIK